MEKEMRKEEEGMRIEGRGSQNLFLMIMSERSV